MKKMLFSVMTIVLCLITLIGCKQDIQKADAQEVFCRVECVKEDGIIVWRPDVTPEESYIFVKLENSDPEIAVFDTVVINFSEDDLKTSNGTFLGIDGVELGYSCVLENPQIRFPDTSKDEPTYG